MSATAHLNQTIVIRSSRYLSVILFCIAPVILLFGVMDLIPSMQGYDPHTGLLLCAGALAVAIVGILLLNYRPPKVYLTPLELQLPGYGIPRIPWSVIVRADVFEVHARGTVLYLGILLTDSARRNFNQPAPMKALKASSTSPPTRHTTSCSTATCSNGLPSAWPTRSISAHPRPQPPTTPSESKHPLSRVSRRCSLPARAAPKRPGIIPPIQPFRFFVCN
jgi:hypothetical protein